MPQNPHVTRYGIALERFPPLMAAPETGMLQAQHLPVDT